MKDLKAKHLRYLDISAASGLLYLNKLFYVCADDELSLSIYEVGKSQAIKRIQLLQGELPKDTAQRKKLKPDFESILFLDDLNSILVLPSGSTPQRMKGCLVKNEVVTEVDFSRLFTQIIQKIPELNIEGVAAVNKSILLFNRGNGENQLNAVIKIDLDAFCKEIIDTKVITEKSLLNIKHFSFGNKNAQNLGITDVVFDGDKLIWFLAVAEDTESTYHDGEFLGAYVGAMDIECNIIYQERLDIITKPEGLALDEKNKKMYIVTDPDDRSKSSELLVLELPNL